MTQRANADKRVSGRVVLVDALKCRGLAIASAGSFVAVLLVPEFYERPCLTLATGPSIPFLSAHLEGHPPHRRLNLWLPSDCRVLSFLAVRTHSIVLRYSLLVLLRDVMRLWVAAILVQVTCLLLDPQSYVPAWA